MQPNVFKVANYVISILLQFTKKVVSESETLKSYAVKVSMKQWEEKWDTLRP